MRIKFLDTEELRMNKVNAIMMTKKNMVILPECEKHVPFTSAKTVSVAEACTMVSKMLSVGYVPDAMLYNWLTTADRTTAIDIYDDIMDNIKEMVGVRNTDQCTETSLNKSWQCLTLSCLLMQLYITLQVRTCTNAK